MNSCWKLLHPLKLHHSAAKCCSPFLAARSVEFKLCGAPSPLLNSNNQSSELFLGDSVKQLVVVVMDYGLRIVCALITFSIGISASFLWVRLWSDQSNRGLDNRIPAGNVTGKITFRFNGCAGNRAVFLLDNGTDHRIFARVQRVDFWKEFKEADLEYGTHLVRYKAPGAHDYVDASPIFDAVEPFQVIMSHQTIRYGIDLSRGPGEYIVAVPYMEDSEVARSLDEDFPRFLKHEFERVKASWKRVSSDVVTNTCR